ncbi:carboxypeptidase S [Hortaea werneckii]|nr:carboxypeptidase S [Hortaea werneckii]
MEKSLPLPVEHQAPRPAKSSIRRYITASSRTRLTPHRETAMLSPTNRNAPNLPPSSPPPTTTPSTERTTSSPPTTSNRPRSNATPAPSRSPPSPSTTWVSSAKTRDGTPASSSTSTSPTPSRACTSSDASLKPLVLMAHQDVVPVPASTVDAWTHPPFSGFYDGQFIWGRGSIDCKNQLIAEMEVLEGLLEAGFEPRRSIVLSFGFDEEISGTQGAGKLAEFLLQRYGRDGVAALVDEGAGMSEMWCSIGVMSELITAIEAQQYPTYLADDNPILGLLQCSAEHAPEFPSKLKKLLDHRSPAALQTSPKPDYLALEAAKLGRPVQYLMQTSQAVDVIQGGAKVNALPERTSVTINHRINIGDAPDDIYSHLTSLAKPLAEKYSLRLHAFDGVEEDENSISLFPSNATLRVAPVTPSTLFSDEEQRTPTPYNILAATTRALYGSDLIVSPAMMTGNTDTRYYWGLTPHIFRYGPGYDPDWIPEGGLGRIHTVDEKVRIWMGWMWVRRYLPLKMYQAKIRSTSKTPLLNRDIYDPSPTHHTRRTNHQFPRRGTPFQPLTQKPEGGDLGESDAAEEEDDGSLGTLFGAGEGLPGGGSIGVGPLLNDIDSGAADAMEDVFETAPAGCRGHGRGRGLCRGLGLLTAGSGPRGGDGTTIRHDLVQLALLNYSLHQPHTERRPPGKDKGDILRVLIFADVIRPQSQPFANTVPFRRRRTGRTRDGVEEPAPRKGEGVLIPISLEDLAFQRIEVTCAKAVREAGFETEQTEDGFEGDVAARDELFQAVLHCARRSDRVNLIRHGLLLVLDTLLFALQTTGSAVEKRPDSGEVDIADGWVEFVSAVELNFAPGCTAATSTGLSAGLLLALRCRSRAQDRCIDFRLIVRDAKHLIQIRGKRPFAQYTVFLKDQVGNQGPPRHPNDGEVKIAPALTSHHSNLLCTELARTFTASRIFNVKRTTAVQSKGDVGM